MLVAYNKKYLKALQDEANEKYQDLILNGFTEEDAFIEAVKFIWSRIKPDDKPE